MNPPLRARGSNESPLMVPECAVVLSPVSRATSDAMGSVATPGHAR